MPDPDAGSGAQVLRQWVRIGFLAHFFPKPAAVLKRCALRPQAALHALSHSLAAIPLYLHPLPGRRFGSSFCLFSH